MRMQKLSAETRQLAPVVERVPCDWVSDRPKMSPDLVCPAGMKLQLEQVKTGELLENSVRRPGPPRRDAVNSHATSVSRIAADWPL